MTPTTLELRACSAAEAQQLVAGLGLLAAPQHGDGWFAAHAVLEDDALLELLLSRIAACHGAADPRAALLDRHATVVRATLAEAAIRLGAVPALSGAHVRFSALGLPIALALPLDDWISGSDRVVLRRLAAERAESHLAPLRERLRRDRWSQGGSNP